MISQQNLLDIAKSRFQESRILFTNDRYDGAVYLCGYALELMLKRHIVKILNWDGYPEDNPEFKKYQSFKVHNLDVLLHLSGLEKKIQSDVKMLTLWQIAGKWDSEIRYRQIGQLSKREANDIIEASRELLKYLLKL